MGLPVNVTSDGASGDSGVVVLSGLVISGQRVRTGGLGKGVSSSMNAHTVAHSGLLTDH